MSLHGTFRTRRDVRLESVMRSKPDTDYPADQPHLRVWVPRMRRLSRLRLRDQIAGINDKALANRPLEL
jgi:hypothetical protein